MKAIDASNGNTSGNNGMLPSAALGSQLLHKHSRGHSAQLCLHSDFFWHSGLKYDFIPYAKAWGSARSSLCLHTRWAAWSSRLWVGDSEVCLSPSAGEDLFVQTLVAQNLFVPSRLQLRQELGLSHLPLVRTTLTCPFPAWGGFHFLASSPEVLLTAHWVFIWFSDSIRCLGSAVNSLRYLKKQLWLPP
jgi:hypothetical protein